jgi:hypothetical protein
MPTTALVPTPSDAPVGQQKKAQDTAVASIPFARSSKWHTEQGNNFAGIVINSVTPGTYNFPIPSYGYLSAIFLTAIASGGSGSAAVFYEDAPWSIIQSIQISDVNGVPIFGPIGGYSAYLCAKYGGYRFFPLDGSATTYGAGTAATAPGNTPLYYTATTGNFGFVLPVYFEFGRDGLGALPNMDASAKYNCQIIVASATAAANVGPVYTTAPTGYPTLTLQLEGLYRSQPPASDLYGNQNSLTPPAVGTIQYWTQQTFSSLSGTQTLQLTRVGNLIRNHLLIFRDPGATPTRGVADTSDMPPTLEFDWDSSIRYMENVATARQISYQSYGFDVPKGVIALPNTLDPDKIAGSEFGDEWMATVGATKLTLRFTPAASCNLTVLTNDLVAANSQVYAAPMLQGGY